MYLVREYLENTYVVDADVYISENFLLEKPETSMYFSANKQGFKGEWKLSFDEDLKVNDIEVGDDEGYILCGVSYWDKKDTDIIVKELEDMVENGDFSELYWDDIVKNNISKLDIRIEKISENSIYEIDNLEELDYVKSVVEK